MNSPSDRIRTFQSEQHHKKIGTAIDVVKNDDGVIGPGDRHWTPHLRSSVDQVGAASMSHTGCDEPVTGMILTPGTIDDVSCDNCKVAYVARFLNREPDDA